MLRHKREMLDAANRATEKLRMQVRMAMSDRDRQLREQQLAMLASAVDKLANSGGSSLPGGGGGGDSKLDAILAQTLQMQGMFMARMAQGDGGGVGGGSMMMGMGDGGGGVRPFIGKDQGVRRNAQGEMVGDRDGAESPSGGVMGGDEQQRMMMRKQGLLPQESTRSPEDDELLVKMMKLTEELANAEGVAKSSADAAVEAAAKAVVQANPNLDLKKKKVRVIGPNLCLRRRKR